MATDTMRVAAGPCLGRAGPRPGSDSVAVWLGGAAREELGSTERGRKRRARVTKGIIS